jgi:2',3'-cyclic-nucleotide 2'-phosphodiesterase (5'-nucleotidase family)
MKKLFPLFALLSLLGVSCSEEVTITDQDQVAFSFAFTGCNRVGWGSGTTPSTANHVALDSIVYDMIRQENKPELFFNLGDIVRGEQTDTIDLASQLRNWTGLKTVKKLDSSGIRMVAVPGNHELLQSVKDTNGVYHEYPLNLSTEVFIEYMSDYLPTNRDTAPDALNLDNRLTFSFIKDSIGFVVINTDTYNSPQGTNNYGSQGLFPIEWVNNKIVALNNDPSVKHIFALGHRSYYVNGSIPHGNHNGLPNAKSFWDTMNNNKKAVAYLSAHTHDYQRYQPSNTGITQVIAGNAGSPNGAARFFGYSQINIFESGKVQLVSRGYCVPKNPDDYRNPPLGNMKLQDSTFLSIEGNSNPIAPYSVNCKG